MEFLKYWPNSCDFNKLVIKIKIHAKTYFFEVFFIVWKYDMVFSLRDFAVCLKTKTNFFNFLMFWQKSGILISDLYLYSIKIQTNIKQNLVKKNVEKLQFLKFFFFEFSRTQLFGLGQNWPSHEQWLSTVHMLREHWRLVARRSRRG